KPVAIDVAVADRAEQRVTTEPLPEVRTSQAGNQYGERRRRLDTRLAGRVRDRRNRAVGNDRNVAAAVGGQRGRPVNLPKRCACRLCLDGREREAAAHEQPDSRQQCDKPKAAKHLSLLSGVEVDVTSPT